MVQIKSRLSCKIFRFKKQKSEYWWLITQWNNFENLTVFEQVACSWKKTFDIGTQCKIHLVSYIKHVSLYHSKWLPRMDRMRLLNKLFSHWMLYWEHWQTFAQISFFRSLFCCRIRPIVTTTHTSWMKTKKK